MAVAPERRALNRTAELRWFFAGPPPAPVRRWFDGFGGPPEERTDRYLRLGGTDRLGLKLRGGEGLELKVRRGDPVPHAWPGGLTGGIERWDKWSVPGFSGRRLASIPARYRLDVHKRRRTVTCRVAPDGRLSLAPGPAGRRDGAGCAVELAEVRAAGVERVTLGFEAYGPEAHLLPVVLAAADTFFGAAPLDGWSGAEPGGYPAWLHRLAGFPAS